MMYIFEGENYTVSYATYGEGLPVVLLHGFGEDATIFNLQIKALEKKCKLIIPNIPGTGNATLLYEKMEPTVENLADCIKTLLDHLKIDKCILLGHSMGGYITLAFADKYPDSLMSFGLIHSTAFADTEEKKNNRLRGIQLMNDYGAASFLRTTFPNLFSNLFKTEKYKELEELITRFANISTDTCVFYFKSMIARTDKTSLLRNTSLPVLFVIGEEDIAAPMADVLQQVSLPAYSTVNILENVGHMSMVEAPDKLNDILIEFIKEVQQ